MASERSDGACVRAVERDLGDSSLRWWEKATRDTSGGGRTGAEPGREPREDGAAGTIAGLRRSAGWGATTDDGVVVVMGHVTDHARAAANIFRLIASCVLNVLDAESYLADIIRVLPY